MIIAALMGALGTILGVTITNFVSSRTARRSAELTATVQTREIEQQGWQQHYEAWKDEALQLRRLRDEDQQRYEANRRNLEARFAEMSEKVNAMETRMTTMTRERAEERVFLEAIIAWCRVVVRLLREAGIAYPPLPPGVVADTDPDGLPAQSGQ